jgi:ABC-type polysaccharide/polyol phosphate transport system ATPase subunit
MQGFAGYFRRRLTRYGQQPEAAILLKFQPILPTHTTPARCNEKPLDVLARNVLTRFGNRSPPFERGVADLAMPNPQALSRGDLVLAARGVSKSYEIDVKPASVFFERLAGVKGRRKLFEALKPLDLEIRLGQSIGLLGKNGAGKSTLLGVLSGVIKPTTGRVETHGRVAALIGVGQSFNIDLTGRENAVRFCRIQNLSGRPLEEAVERIADFAELGGHFDLAVKTYSSGMKARLNFSCAASVQADLIIIDEVLAVGDAEFRSKCYGHIETNIANGQTYIMVSHSPAIIGNYCDRALVLDHGEVLFDGDALGAMQTYDSMLKVGERKRRSQEQLFERRRQYKGDQSAERPVDIRSVSLRRLRSDAVIDGAAVVAGEEPLIISAEFQINEDIARPRVGFGLRNGKGIMVSADAETVSDGPWLNGEQRTIEFEFVPRLAVGAYLVRFLVSDVADGERKFLIDREGMLEFHIVEGARSGLVDLGIKMTSNVLKSSVMNIASRAAE